MTKDVLLVAATAQEIAPFLRAYEGRDQHPRVLITGVGMVATAFALGKELQKKPVDFALNVGIGGGFPRTIPLGELVFVEEDQLVELGAEDGPSFLSIEQLGFGKATYNAVPGVPDFLTGGLRKGKGITVNKVHGQEESIQLIQQRINPDVESMEGAAFYYACEQEQIPCAQIRSISNYVERRNRENWKIGLAIHQLNQWLISFFDKLYSEPDSDDVFKK